VRIDIESTQVCSVNDPADWLVRVSVSVGHWC
jgi:hypothetical protein